VAIAAAVAKPRLKSLDSLVSLLSALVLSAAIGCGGASGERRGGTASGGTPAGGTGGTTERGGTGGTPSSGGGAGASAAGGSAGTAGEAGASSGGSAGDGGDSGGGGDGGSGARSGSGGNAGEPVDPVDCEHLDGTPSGVATRGVVRGRNGEFVDECDAEGNLVEYACETVLECGPGPNPACTDVVTGNVAGSVVDCGGECMNGACVVRCVDFGDRMTVLSVQSNGDIVVEHVAHGRRYECTLIFDNPSDDVDCTAEREPGEDLLIEALGVTDPACTAGRYNFGLGPCSYTCERVPL
jgi:hypothetical protein